MGNARCVSAARCGRLSSYNRMRCHRELTGYGRRGTFVGWEVGSELPLHAVQRIELVEQAGCATGCVLASWCSMKTEYSASARWTHPKLNNVHRISSLCDTRRR